jgi:hypothetical protein
VSEPGRIVAWDVSLSVSLVNGCRVGAASRPRRPGDTSHRITKPAQPRAGYLLYRTAQTDVVGF